MKSWLVKVVTSKTAGIWLHQRQMINGNHAGSSAHLTIAASPYVSKIVSRSLIISHIALKEWVSISKVFSSLTDRRLPNTNTFFGSHCLESDTALKYFFLKMYNIILWVYKTVTAHFKVWIRPDCQQSIYQERNWKLAVRWQICVKIPQPERTAYKLKPFQWNNIFRNLKFNCKSITSIASESKGKLHWLDKTHQERNSMYNFNEKIFA